MKSDPRLRKTIKWGGAVVTVLLIGAWVWSGHWGFTWLGRDGLLAGMWRGQVYVAKTGYVHQTGEVDWHLCVRPPLQFDWGVQCRLSRTAWRIEFPLLLPAAVWPLAWVVSWVRAAWRRRRLLRIGLCPKCGYDRAGLVDGVVCPECGTLPKS